jgi:hypothetical protein
MESIQRIVGATISIAVPLSSKTSIQVENKQCTLNKAYNFHQFRLRSLAHYNPDGMLSLL